MMDQDNDVLSRDGVIAKETKGKHTNRESLCPEL